MVHSYFSAHFSNFKLLFRIFFIYFCPLLKFYCKTTKFHQYQTLFLQFIENHQKQLACFLWWPKYFLICWEITINELQELQVYLLKNLLCNLQIYCELLMDQPHLMDHPKDIYLLLSRQLLLNLSLLFILLKYLFLFLQSLYLILFKIVLYLFKAMMLKVLFQIAIHQIFCLK